MKRLKWIATLLVVANLLLGVIGCKDPEIHIHTYSEAWTSDANGHWHAATCEHTTEVSGKAAHSFGEYVSNNDATTEADGTKTRECSVCGYKDTVTDEGSKIHVHTFAEEWTSDSSGHWHAATCGHEVTEGKTAHTFGDWTTTKEPTETEIGQMQSVCEVCGETVTKELQPAPEGFRFVQGGTVTGALPAWLDESYNVNDGYKGVFIKGRTVTLSDFYMGKYEVTQEEYASVMTGQKVTVGGGEYALEINPNYCTADSTSYTLFNGDVQEKRPVEGVTWYDAVWYCNALSEKEGLTPAYNIEVTKVYKARGKTGYYIYSANVTLNTKANGYRLPTEAEWEYAARGGDPIKDDWNYVFSGADTAAGVYFESSKNAGLDSVGWYRYNNITGTTGDSDVTLEVSGKGTHQVGKKAPNMLGLYDMSGNVGEWCYDLYETVNTGEESDPTGATSESVRVYRGGFWSDSAPLALVSSRTSIYQGGRHDNIGFRVVRPAN